MENIQKNLREIKELLLAEKIYHKDFLTVKEASIYLDVSESHIHKLTSRKEIPHFKPRGKKIYFRKIDLDNWILSGKVDSVAELERQVEIYLANPSKKVQL